MGFFAAAGESRGEIKTLERREQDYEETLEARVGGEVFEIPLQVSAQVYEPGKIEEYLEEAGRRDWIGSIVGKDLSQPGNRGLVFAGTGGRTSGYGFLVQTDHPEILHWTGRVERSEQKQQVLLQAELICRGRKEAENLGSYVLPADKQKGSMDVLKKKRKKGQENKTGNTLFASGVLRGSEGGMETAGGGNSCCSFRNSRSPGDSFDGIGITGEKKETGDEGAADDGRLPGDSKSACAAAQCRIVRPAGICPALCGLSDEEEAGSQGAVCL